MSGQPRRKLPEAQQRILRQRMKWESRLMSVYQLTTDEYAWLLYRQRFLCPICGQCLTITTGCIVAKAAVIDHCHRTGQVRGILCTYCNWKVLGAAERAGRERMTNVMRYLWPR